MIDFQGKFSFLYKCHKINLLVIYYKGNTLLLSGPKIAQRFFFVFSVSSMRSSWVMSVDKLRAVVWSFARRLGLLPDSVFFSSYSWFCQVPFIRHRVDFIHEKLCLRLHSKGGVYASVLRPKNSLVRSHVLKDCVFFIFFFYSFVLSNIAPYLGED